MLETADCMRDSLLEMKDELERFVHVIKANKESLKTASDFLTYICRKQLLEVLWTEVFGKFKKTSSEIIPKQPRTKHATIELY